MTSFEASLTRVTSALRVSSRGLVDREVLTELIVLGAIAGEHLLVVGPPGTAKSHAVRQVAAQIQGRYFEYLLGRFTEPAELFGAIDLGRLRQGEIAVLTAGMLPEAEVAFLDEVFLGSTAILNTLLGILNERRFVHGQTRVTCPLRICVGAANALPQEPILEAFADRFLLRVFVEPLADEMLETLLEVGARVERPLAAEASIADIDTLSAAALHLDLAPVRAALAEVVRALRAAGTALSDRRIVKLQRLVAAATVLRGANVPSEADLWPLVFAQPTAEAQAVAREVAGPLLVRSQNASLTRAVEEASRSPLARAERLERQAAELLDLERDGSFRRKAEAWLREVDASLAAAQRTTGLEQKRALVMAAALPS